MKAKGYYYYYYPHDLESSKAPNKPNEPSREKAEPRTSRSETADGAWRGPASCSSPFSSPSRRSWSQAGLPARRPAPVASVRILDGTLQRGDGKSWKCRGSRLPDRARRSLRTSADGAALLTFPWMQILVADDTVVGLTPSAVLSATLERGRIQERPRPATS